MAFFKYPRTPHLGSRSTVVDDDKRLSVKEFAAMVEAAPAAQTRAKDAREVAEVGEERQYTVVLQEKVDGTNVSVHFEEEWTPIVQKRSGLLDVGEAKQYQMFRDWVFNNLERLFSVCGEEYCLFGEWLWCEHGVHYNGLTSFFLAFDLLHKATKVFVSTGILLEKLSAAGIESPPLLLQKSMTMKEIGRDLEELAASAMAGSQLSTEGALAEGVYVRIEDEGQVLTRAKMRRSTFVSGREDFARNLKVNELRSSREQYT